MHHDAPADWLRSAAALAQPAQPSRSPSRFIPILEETGLIDQVGEWVLATACEQASTWPGHLSVAVNVSPVQVGNARFAQKVADILARTGLPAQRLELEITESVFLDNEKAAVERLNEWRALGVRVALDDFGKGYSSFEYLSWVPVDILKIDRSFIARFDPDDPNLRVRRSCTAS
ncbi:EAL domain-containing protein [Pannonibacter sp. Pt2-lr]